MVLHVQYNTDILVVYILWYYIQDFRSLVTYVSVHVQCNASSFSWSCIKFRDNKLNLVCIWVGAEPCVLKAIDR